MLNAIQDNTQISAKAFDAANHVQEHLSQLDVKAGENRLSIDTVISALADEGSIVTGVMTLSDIGRVLQEMKKSADRLESYAHENVHRLNNLLHVVLGQLAEERERREAEERND